MSARTTRTASALRTLMTVAAATLGCGAGTDLAEGDEEVDAITVREGDYDLATANGGGQPYTDIAVLGSKGYLAKGYEGVHVLDLRTMRVTQRVWADRAGRRVPADSLQVIARNQLLATYQGNRLGDLSDDRQYLTLTVFNTTSQTVTRTISIDLTGSYESGTGLNDLPNLATYVDTATGTLWIAFGHLRRPDKLYAFPLPTANAELRLTALPGARSFTVENPHAVWSDGRTAFVPSSSDGLRAVDLATGRASVRAANIGYALDIAVNRTTGFVADHDGNLRVLNLSTGAVVATREVPGFTDGLTYSGGQVFVAWRNGVSVFRDTWSTR